MTMMYNMERRVTLIVDNTKLHLVLGKTYDEWEKLYSGDVFWDILFEELIDGSVEINDKIWYWYIDGRCYETFEQV